MKKVRKRRTRLPKGLPDEVILQQRLLDDVIWQFMEDKKARELQEQRQHCENVLRSLGWEV